MRMYNRVLCVPAANLYNKEHHATIDVKLNLYETFKLCIDSLL